MANRENICEEAKLKKTANHQKFSIGLANTQIECQKGPLAEWWLWRKQRSWQKKIAKGAPSKVAKLTKMANLTALTNQAKMANVAKICHGFGEYSNFMTKGVLWRVEILTKIANMTKILQTFKPYRKSTESGKKSPKARGWFKLDYKRNSL